MTTLSKEDVVVHPYWKSCTNKEEIIIALTANASAGDSGAAMRSDVTDAINRAIQLARADLVTENERLKREMNFVELALPEDYSESKDWKFDKSPVARIEWLKIWHRYNKNRISDLESLIDKHDAAISEKTDQLTATRAALAAAEADNERLREVIFSAQTTFDAYVSIHNAKNPPNLEKVSFNQSRSDMCSEALTQPCDDSALREMIAGIYEECVQACKQFQGPHRAMTFNNELERCMYAIRALAEKAKGE